MFCQKDRPLQSQVLLDSFEKYIIGHEKINILFLATNDLSKKCYHNLSLKYSRKEIIGLNGFLR